MIGGFSNGYKIWPTRVEESPVDKPVVHQEIFDRISSVVYKTDNTDIPLFVRLGSGEHFRVHASTEVPFENCVSLPISDDILRKRIPFNTGALVAEGWLVETFWTLDGEKYY